MTDVSQQPPDFHILALSGGGFRGLYTATVLRHIEESLGAPLANRFDLICGTSAGGLLALGLAPSALRASGHARSPCVTVSRGPQ